MLDAEQGPGLCRIPWYSSGIPQLAEPEDDLGPWQLPILAWRLPFASGASHVANCRTAAAWLAGFDNPDDYQPVHET